MDKVFIRKLTDIILVNLEDEKFGAKELAQKSGMSSSGLNRRLLRYVHKTTTQFLRETRLQKALEMLQNEAITASEVAYRTGFASPAYFSKCFHDFYGYPPRTVNRKNLESEEEAFSDQKKVIYKQYKFAGQKLIFKLFKILILVFFVVTSAIYVFLKFFKQNYSGDQKPPDGKLIVAVMPFQNMTNDTSKNILQDWIQDILISNFSNSEELKVRQTETVRNIIKNSGFNTYASITPDIANKISRKLYADDFIYGNIKQTGSVIRLTAQIIDSKTNELIKSFQLEGPANEENFKMIDSLSFLVEDYLLLTRLKKQNAHYQYLASTNSPEAYRFFMLGDIYFYKLDFIDAADWYLQAIRIDSNFIGALTKLSYSYYNERKYDEAKYWFRKAYEKKKLASVPQKIYIDLVNATLFEPPNEEINNARRLLQFDDQLPTMYYRVGIGFYRMAQYEREITELEKSVEITKKWGSKPDWVLTYLHLGIAYHRTGQYKKEKRIYRKALRDFPENSAKIIPRQAILSISEGDMGKGEKYISKYILHQKADLETEADITADVAIIYNEAGILNKAEDNYRKALSLEPYSIQRLNNLAYFLIDKERNINEGLQLADLALQKSPDNYVSLHYKGWGLYKLGKYNEALELLEKSWKLKPVYNHMIYLHLEEAKRAVTANN